MSPTARSRPWLFWQLQIGGWVLFVPPSTGAALAVYTDPGNILLTGLFRQALSFFLTLGLWRFYRRWPAATFRLAPHFLQIALACAAVAALDSIIVEIVRRSFDLPVGPPSIRSGAALIRLSLYMAWTSLYFMIRFELESRDRELRFAQAETAAREAELATLRAQINPHFLFNSLTSILAECDDNPRAVRAISRSLADYLRTSLLQRDHRVPLGEELNAIAGYLNVEHARFEERLVYTFSIEEAAREVLVPTAALLPLVENAVKYGMRTSPRPLRITVAATLYRGSLMLSVENSGRWVDPRPDAADCTQIGLTNLRRRLALLHGDQATLSIHHDPHHVRITIVLPATKTNAPAPSSRTPELETSS